MCLGSSGTFAKDQLAEDSKTQHGIFQDGLIFMALATEDTVTVFQQWWTQCTAGRMFFLVCLFLFFERRLCV